MRRGPLLLGTLAVVGIAAAWALWPTSGTSGPRADAPEEGGAESASGAEILAGKDRVAALDYRVENGVAVPQGPVSNATGPGVLVVQVVDEDGKPIPGRTVWLLGVATGPGEQPLARKADGSGICRWTGLPEGLAAVQASAPRRINSPQSCSIGGPIVVLRCEGTYAARLRVVGPDGVPVARAEVALFAPPNAGERQGLNFISGRLGSGVERLGGARSGEDGIALLAVARRHTYGRLCVRAEGHAIWFEGDWQVGDAEIHLEPAREISGVIRGEGGSILADGVVAWETDRGLWGAERVEWDGTFEISDLPARPVRLEWLMPEARSLDGRNVINATPGSGQVAFVVTVGARLTVQIQGWPRDPRGVATLTRQDGPPSDQPLRSEIDVEGVVRFVGLEPDRKYVLWALPPGSNVGAFPEVTPMGVVYRRDLVASDSTVVVPLVPGRAIRGVVDLAGTAAAGPVGPRGPWRSVSVVLRGVGVSLHAWVPDPVDATDPNEVPFRVYAVPEGEFTLHARLQLDDGEGRTRSWVGEVPAPSTDEPVRIGLRPAPAESR